MGAERNKGGHNDGNDEAAEGDPPRVRSSDQAIIEAAGGQNEGNPSRVRG